KMGLLGKGWPLMVSIVPPSPKTTVRDAAIGTFRRSWKSLFGGDRGMFAVTLGVGMAGSVKLICISGNGWLVPLAMPGHTSSGTREPTWPTELLLAGAEARALGWLVRVYVPAT